MAASCFRAHQCFTLEAATQTAIDGSICACVQRGHAAEKSVSGRLMLRVDPAIPAATIKDSARNGQSLNESDEKASKEAAHA